MSNNIEIHVSQKISDEFGIQDNMYNGAIENVIMHLIEQGESTENIINRVKSFDHPDTTVTSKVVQKLADQV